MKLGTDYMQFSKALALCMLLAYIIQVMATFAAICAKIDLSEPLLQLMNISLSFYGIVYGCYAGNSAIEKAVNAGKLASPKPDTSGNVG